MIWVAGILAVLTAALSLAFPQSAVFERPTQSASVLLFISGFSLFFLCIRIPNFVSPSPHAQNEGDWPLQDLPHSGPDTEHQEPARLTRLHLVVVLVLAISIRVWVVRALLDNRQCTSSSIEGFLPLLLALHHSWLKRRRKSEDNPLPDNQGLGSFFRRIPFQQMQYILSAAILVGVYVSVASSAAFPPSTYICPVSTHGTPAVPFLQMLGVVLDAYILITLYNALDALDTSSISPPTFLGLTLMTSAGIVTLVGLVAFFTHPSQWGWALALDRAYISSLALWALILSTVLTCALRIMASHGPLHLVMCLYIPISYAGLIAFAQSNARLDFFPDRTPGVMKRFTALTIGVIIYFQALLSTGGQSSAPGIRIHGRTPLAAICFVAFLFWSWNFLRLPQDNAAGNHPIDGLLSAASVQHDAWLQQASASKTLHECAEEYRRRYKRHPPPGFDAWYRYATERSSVVVDDFDNLMNDLQLFWAIEPAEVRRRTHEAFGDWNEVAKLSIRSGKAEIGPDVKPTHRWMLDGVIAMMNNYVADIPDMDLGFNINDEPRIAIPYDELQRLLKDSTSTGPSKGTVLNEFSKDRASSWNYSAISQSDGPPTPFTDQSFLPSFHTYGSISCPPSSPARRSRLWDTRTLCTACIAPHSTSIFLSNWTLSASTCHQPDLAHLHGFYLSPAAFKPSHTLYPIFSQSKAAGYADIRYPSPWNYIDKAIYAPSPNASLPSHDPPFSQKSATLFWRGATSEGLSRFGEWRGMARQRLVHLANNASASTHFPILLPPPSNLSPQTKNSNTNEESAYTMHSIPASLLPTLGLNISSIHLVSKIDRCWDSDCPRQALEFGLSEPSDFQSHWQYKYLIDLDGAGFSGRFIPFLQSRSLPFKVAGVFREWWDGRVTAWKHFVPVDVRLHGLWSTVAYFNGVRGIGERGVGGMKGREEEGERIAEEGREWVGRVMRKEDMEVYFYRLLLEWGRLTDDRREELGWVG